MKNTITAITTLSCSMSDVDWSGGDGGVVCIAHG